LNSVLISNKDEKLLVKQKVKDLICLIIFAKEMKTAFSNNHKIIIDELLLADYSVIGRSHNEITLLKEGVKYNCRILYHDKKNNRLHLKINGNPIKITIKKDIELLLEKIGIGNIENQSIKELKAPMPGVVLDIKVKEGDCIKKEDSLVILEAMKMENVLTSPMDGVVSSIEVKEKETVEKNTLLIKFE